jgi:hypothetical protein
VPEDIFGARDSGKYLIFLIKLDKKGETLHLLGGAIQ